MVFGPFGGIRLKAIPPYAVIGHEHLILWGSLDPFISRGDMEEMAATMPDCRLLVIPDVGHSLLIECPEIYVQHFVRMFSPD